MLEGDAPFNVDTSAWWRFSSLPSELIDKAIFDDRLWITPIIRMEILYSARNSAEYIAFEMELDGFRILRNDRAVADTVVLDGRKGPVRRWFASDPVELARLL